MTFMNLQTLDGLWYLVETRNGCEVIPADLVGLDIDIAETLTPDPKHPEAWEEMENDLKPYLESCEVSSVELIRAWGARYSAPGYLDCTDWVLADSEDEAIEECKRLFGEDEDAEEYEEEEIY